MIKDVLVYLSQEQDRDVAGECAISLAKLFNAHLSAISGALFPVYPATAAMDVFGADVVSAARATNKQRAETALQRFRQSAAAAGVSSDGRVNEGTVAETSRRLSEAARRFDITVVGQARPESDEAALFVESLLFGSGRPSLLVPYIQRHPLKGVRVAVCWDGSRTAARAIGDSLPFLQRARKVDLVSVVAHGSRDASPDSGMEKHLARHGVDTSPRHFVTGKGEEASAILNHVSDAGCDLIVMGAYGHSRLREFILGGVTRQILASMTVPVLMSH